MTFNPLARYLESYNAPTVSAGRRIRRARFLLRYGWFIAIVPTAVIVVLLILYFNYRVDAVMRAVLP